jgi:voltage-dependent potassium channel beta subunit
MQYRRLGNAGMKVSVIAMGGWINYGEGKVDRDEAERIVVRAYELGINYFDLADVYGRGEAEKQMGATLRQFPRHTLVIATKVFWPMSDDINDRGLSRKHIMESIDKSLQRLGTEYVDIYFCHRPDPETPVEETVRAMHDLVVQGKVLYWGTSEWSGAQIAAALEVCERYGLHKPRTEQPQYSLLHCDFVEQDVLPVTTPNGIGLVLWSPLAQGMLTGKYDNGVEKDTRFGREEWAKSRFFTDTNIARVRNLKAIADGLGITRTQLALAWTLRHKGVSSAITSATRIAQIEESVGAADVSLSEDVLTAIERVMTA